MSIQAIVHALDQISDDVEPRAPEAAALLDAASTLLVASDANLLPAVEELASVLRSKLPGLDQEESVTLATKLITQYGDDGELAEAALPFNQHERKRGPHPGMGLYAPGKPDWWNVKP